MTKLTASFWDKYFGVYDVLNELLPYRHLIQSLVSALAIKPGDRVLDAGAGTGNVSLPISAAGGIPTGFDISTSGMKLFKKKIPNAEYVIGDLSRQMPFADHTFDKVVSNNVIYAIHPESRALLGSELFRVLKPGGKIVIANIAPGFRPFEIYTAHLKEEFAQSGLIQTFFKILSFTIPTIKMFYYNTLIRREHKGGEYSFMDEKAQEDFLRSAGFVHISDSVRLYGGHGVLTSAEKPL